MVFLLIIMLKYADLILIQKGVDLWILSSHEKC